MMKCILTALFFCLIGINTSQAQFLKDDRYPNWDNRMTGKLHHKQIHHKKHKYSTHKKKVKRFLAPPFRVQRTAGARFAVDVVNAFTTPIRAIAGAVIHGGKPSGAPRAWCGFWLGRHLGMPDRRLWLARNWAGVGSAASASAGSVVVWKHHVGLITAVDGHRIRVLSGNDGHRVRERWRTMAGVIAFRRI